MGSGASTKPQDDDEVSSLSYEAPVAEVLEDDDGAIAEGTQTVDRIISCFRKVDTDGDGKISREELKRVLVTLNPDGFKPRVVDAVMDMVGVSDDGLIDYVSFARWTQGNDGSSFVDAVEKGRWEHRLRCKYGADCYNKDAKHVDKFCYPGDADFDNPNEGLPPSELSLPPYWRNSFKDSSAFDDKYYVAVEHHCKFDELLRSSYIAKCTQDRPCPRGTCGKVPMGCPCVQPYPPDVYADLPPEVLGLPTCYRVRRVIRIEDSNMRKTYARNRYDIRTLRKGERVRQFDPPLLNSEVITKYPDVIDPLEHSLNEAYVFHGTSVQAALSIAEDDFRTDLAGSGAGTMYGQGVYLAESSTKADEYARDDRGTCYDGVFAMLLCRCIMGKMYYTTGRKEEAEAKVKKGWYDSTIGDRARFANTFRELVAYDAGQVYPEYVIFYHRVHHRDEPAEVESKLREELSIDSIQVL